MLTRAYDAIMASLQVPMITNANVDYNASAIDDSVLNCKDCAGTVRTVLSASYYNNSGMSSHGLSSYCYPFVVWAVNNTYTYVLPDEEASAPDYEDYSVTNATPSGWTVSSASVSFKKTYDPDTKEFVCSVTVLFQNTSGAAKTVYGVKVRCQYNYRTSYSSSGTGGATHFLVCREHFAAPVVVENNAIISLSFTWRVGRAGLVAATAASAST